MFFFVCRVLRRSGGHRRRAIPGTFTSLLPAAIGAVVGLYKDATAYRLEGADTPPYLHLLVELKALALPCDLCIE
jgi:hypothetical protein